MKIALKALETAEEQKRQQKYKEMFETLMKAEDEVYSNEEAHVKVTETYDVYKTEYLNNLYEQIGTPETIREYDNAIIILEKAVNVLPNENQLSSYLSLYKDSKPIDFIESFTAYAYKDYNNYHYSEQVLTKDGKKLVFGDTEYSHYIRLGTCSKIGCEMYYNISGKYDTLTLKVYSTGNASIDILGDDNILINTYNIVGKNLPKTVTMSVTDVSQLCFKSRGDGGVIYIVDAIIQKNN